MGQTTADYQRKGTLARKVNVELNGLCDSGYSEDEGQSEEEQLYGVGIGRV